MSNPASPTPSETSVGAAAASGVIRSANAPQAVFQTTPAVGPEGTILGTSPLTVEFNLCQSRPASEEDRLRFSYDFDGDGGVDFFGHCRAIHVFENANGAQACAPARVCVSDRRPDGEVCRTFEVCVEGSSVEPEPEPAAVPPAEEGE
jgi:hypothetical protein